MGGRLAHFVEKWEEITDNKWVLCRTTRIQDTIQQNYSFVICSIRMSQSSSPFLREEIENLLNKRALERVQNPGTPGFYSRIFLVPKKNGKLRLIIDLSLLNRYIKKQSFKMETVKSLRQAMRLNDWAVSKTKQMHIYMFGMSLSPLIFSKLMDIIAAFLRQRAISVFPYLDDWLIKNLKKIDYSDKILHSDPFSEIHLYRHGISDTTKCSQGSNGSCTESTSNNQEISVIQTCISTNFSFSFGQTQCFSRLRSPRQTSLTSSIDVSFVCLFLSII